jgi:hypothetical protein
MTQQTSSLSIGQDASVALAADLEGGRMIDPRDYAEAIARATGADLTVVAVNEPGMLLFEIWINEQLKARMPKEEATWFLDGIIAGVNISRGKRV